MGPVSCHQQHRPDAPIFLIKLDRRLHYPFNTVSESAVTHAPGDTADFSSRGTSTSAIDGSDVSAAIRYVARAVIRAACRSRANYFAA